MGRDVRLEGREGKDGGQARLSGWLGAAGASSTLPIPPVQRQTLLSGRPFRPPDHLCDQGMGGEVATPRTKTFKKISHSLNAPVASAGFKGRIFLMMTCCTAGRSTTGRHPSASCLLTPAAHGRGRDAHGKEDG